MQGRLCLLERCLFLLQSIFEQLVEILHWIGGHLNFFQFRIPRCQCFYRCVPFDARSDYRFIKRPVGDEKLNNHILLGRDRSREIVPLLFYQHSTFLTRIIASSHSLKQPATAIECPSFEENTSSRVGGDTSPIFPRIATNASNVARNVVGIPSELSSGPPSTLSPGSSLSAHHSENQRWD